MLKRGFKTMLAEANAVIETVPFHNPALNPARRVIRYCSTGGRSARAAKTPGDMGFEDFAAGATESFLTHPVVL
jgi:rhodanese-related sulfurtransferase